MLQMLREFLGGEMRGAFLFEITASRRDSAGPPDYGNSELFIQYFPYNIYYGKYVS